MNTRAFRILVADRFAHNRRMFRNLLERHDLEVVEAGSSDEILPRVRETRIDLLLLDVLMPGLELSALLQRLRREFDIVELPVIVVGPHEERGLFIEAMDQGASDFITTPIDFQTALARIRARLDIKSLAELKDRFLAIASHDLKKPAMLISDIAVTLLEESTLDEPDREAIAMVHRSGSYMMRIIQDFLDFQALSDGKLRLNAEPVQLSTQVRHAVEGSRSYAERKQISLACELEQDPPWVLADVNRLTQVIDNLLGNAIKYCPPGSEVMLRTWSADELTVLEVIDSGPGLSDADLRHIFHLHARGSRQPTGGESSSGYGLAISRELIELHGGYIGARNNPERGATFWFALPLADAEARHRA